MIGLTVNLPEGRESTYRDLRKVGVSEAIDAAKLLHPDWTSIVLVLSKVTKD